MERNKELRRKAEFVLWSARKEAHRLRVDGLQEKLLAEREDVERLESGGIFARLKNLGRFEENLDKEKEEAVAAQEELERVESLLKEAGKRISRLQNFQHVPLEEPLESALDKEESALSEWTSEMELAGRTAAENNHCIEYARKKWEELKDGILDREEIAAFGDRVDDLFRMTGEFLRSMGDVQIIPGIKQKTWRRTYYVNGGKTVLFLQDGKPVREVYAHSFGYRGLRSKVELEEALLWTILDLEKNKLLFAELIEEKVREGEELLREMNQSGTHER